MARSSGWDAGVGDERVGDARPELADRLDDAGPLVARGVRQRPEQRRHAAGIAEVAERLDRRGADLLVRIVEAGEQRPQRAVGPDQAERARAASACRHQACAVRSFFQRSIRPSASAAARAASTGEPDATRSGLIRSAPIWSRCRGGAWLQPGDRGLEIGRPRAPTARRRRRAGRAPAAASSRCSRQLATRVADQDVGEQHAERDEARLEEDDQVVAKQVRQQEHRPRSLRSAGRCRP